MRGHKEITLAIRYETIGEIIPQDHAGSWEKAAGVTDQKGRCEGCTDIVKEKIGDIAASDWR